MKINEYRDARPTADKYLRAKEAVDYLRSKKREEDVRVEVRSGKNDLLITHELPVESVIQALELRMTELAVILRTHGVEAY